MSVSIYYNFTSDKDLSKMGVLNKICELWDKEFDGNPYESWSWYEPEINNGHYKYAGATKLIMNEELGPKSVFIAVQLLTIIRNKFGGTGWSVNLDDIEIPWNDEDQSFVLE